jgi:collagenase-like PrtC family protease
VSNVLKIAAPVSSAEEAEQAFRAGADEVYFGLLLPEWIAEFDDADLWTRRQGKPSHVGDFVEAAAIARVATAHGGLASLAMNARYSRLQIESVLQAIQRWETSGGQAVVIGDLGVLAALGARRTRLRCHLSLLAGVFNARSAAALAALGACRVILPRELTIREMKQLTRAAPPVEYEALALNQRCPFVDGMCGFHHRQMLPDGTPAEFDYRRLEPGRLPTTTSCDPAYEGHGCRLPWRTVLGPVSLPTCDDYHQPHCAACQVRELRHAGVTVLKIAGRGYPGEVIQRAVRFLRAAADRSCGTDPAEHFCAGIRRLYRETFSTPCEPGRCYYRSGDF